MHLIKRYFPYIASSFFLLLFGISFFTFYYRDKQVMANVMVSDIAKLASLFTTIDKQCTILSFDYEKNHINFLNVGTFSSSEVGSMNLAHPEHWQGPYVDDNPTMQGKEYEVVRTFKGYYIVPGTGVKLPNGKVIGTDLILNEKSDIERLIQDDLSYNGQALAAPLPLSASKVALPEPLARQSFEEF